MKIGFCKVEVYTKGLYGCVYPERTADIIFIMSKKQLVTLGFRAKALYAEILLLIIISLYGCMVEIK